MLLLENVILVSQIEGKVCDCVTASVRVCLVRRGWMGFPYSRSRFCIRNDVTRQKDVRSWNIRAVTEINGGYHI